MKAKQAYDEDCRRAPNYHDGTPRKKWKELCDVAKSSWIENPTPRNFKTSNKESHNAE